MTLNAAFLAIVQGEITEAYDAVDAILRRGGMPAEVAVEVEAARDALFRARVKLDEE